MSRDWSDRFVSRQALLSAPPFSPSRSADMSKWWGYDFECGKTIDAMHAAFNAAGPWQWRQNDSDIYGFYLRCRPKEHAEVSVYERAQFRTPGRSDRAGFWAELCSAPDAHADIDQQFRALLQHVDAKTIVET
jgi:hypothetical protein